MKQVSEHQQLIDAIGMLISEQQRTTEAVVTLVEAIARTEPKSAPAETTPTPAVDDTPEPVWEEPNCTRDQLQSYCLERVRADKEFKAKLSDVLGQYGVKTISKLKDGEAPKVYAELEEIK